jgi:hypothetical protein
MEESRDLTGQNAVRLLIDWNIAHFPAESAVPGFLQTKARILVGPGAKLFVASCECQSVFSTQKDS